MLRNINEIVQNHIRVSNVCLKNIKWEKHRKAKKKKRNVKKWWSISRKVSCNDFIKVSKTSSIHKSVATRKSIKFSLKFLKFYVISARLIKMSKNSFSPGSPTNSLKKQKSKVSEESPTSTAKSSATTIHENFVLLSTPDKFKDNPEGDTSGKLEPS